MQRLPRLVLSPSAAVALQSVRTFRLLPLSLQTAEAGNGGKGSPNLRSSYDMVIVGDGPVSPALACSISCEPSLSHKNLLLLQPHSKGEASSKVSILLQSSVDLLKRIGVWSELTSQSLVKPFKSVHIWDASSEAHVVFNHSDLSHDQRQDEDDLTVPGLHGDQQSDTPSSSEEGTIGYVVDNQALTSRLLEHLSTYDNVQVETEVKAKVVTKVDNRVADSLVQIMLDNGKHITSNLLVGSDGPNSRVRHLCGFDSIGWSHNQWAFTAAVEVKEAGRNSSVWQRLLPNGPIAMLPLSENTSALLWCTTQDHAHSLLSMSDSDAVVDAINTAFFDTLPQSDIIASVSEALRDTMGIFSSEAPPPHQLPPLATSLVESSRAAAPLELVHTPNYVKDRIALIGEASHQMHPLTGLGLNLGFGDVSALTEQLLDANSRGDDWGSLNHLLVYETDRQRFNVPAMAAVEGFNWFYSSSLSPVVLLRSAGFNVANTFQPIREFVLKQAWLPTNGR